MILSARNSTYGTYTTVARARRLGGRRAFVSLSLVVCLGLLFAGCARSIPAPVVFGSKAPVPTFQNRMTPKPLPRPTQPAQQTQSEIRENLKSDTVSATVASGETIYRFARRHRVALRDLIEGNRLTPPYKLRPGQKLVVPKLRIHRVIKGDTLYRVSRSYGVDMYTVASINLIEAPYVIRTGQKLRLPNQRRASVISTGTAALPSKSESRITKAPETAVASARSSPSRFVWPLRGRVISSYGAKLGGLHNDGINIAASSGAAVVAADAGIVAYAGNELRGFGNLLLLRHAGGWTSAYAHNDKLLVKRGDRVARGEVIAHAGATGRVRRPQLHFELRRQSDAVDPLRFLRPVS